MSRENDRRGGGVVGPVILIGLGVVFLLNNLGVLSWSIWGTLVRLWPVLLVAAGLDLILGRRSIWGSLLALALTFAILGVALWLSTAEVGLGRQIRTQEIAQSLGEVEQAELVVDPGIGRLRIEGASESDNLVEGTVRLTRREELGRGYSVEDGTGVFTLRSQDVSFGPSAVGWGGRRVWDLRLSPDVPLLIDINLGVGESDVDLTDLMVESLDVEHGIGQATIVLPQEGRFEARVEGAIGQTVIFIPETLAARVQLDTGLSGRQVPAGYLCEEDVCTSPDYEDADDRVDLTVGQAIGNVVIARQDS